MSEDKLRRLDAEDPAGPERLLRPLIPGGSGESPRRSPDGLAGEDRLRSIRADLARRDVPVKDGLVTESLDEVLLAMIGAASGETHGTELMDALERRFEVQLSPGTVYPRLHDLESADLLERHELVRTKQYALRDPERARDSIERAATEHLALSLFLLSALEEV